MNEMILAIGAESEILKISKWGQELVLKRRPKKPYLLETIDEYLRTTRIARECKMLMAVRALGVSTPSVYAVDFSEKSILMDFIQGEQLKTLIPKIDDNQKKSLCIKFGEILGRLHKGGFVHGDPTTSNLLVDEKNHIWMIDFGLSEMNATIEMKGVDLHLVYRALETTHWEYQDIMLDAVLMGYSQFIGTEAEETIKRMKEIRERGRYH